jgi:hypothetical protein
MLADAAEASAKSWQFARHAPTAFESTFTFEFSKGSCDADDDSFVRVLRLELPTRAEIRAPGIVLCESGYRPVTSPMVASDASGRITCDCPDDRFTRGVALELRTRESGGKRRTAKTDGQGRFRFSKVPPGTYDLYVPTSPGYGFSFTVAITREANASKTLEIALHDLMQRPELKPTVTAAAVPVYPDSARNAGLQGDVHLRVEQPGGEIVVLDGAPDLARAAVENVKTWQTAEAHRYEVAFHFKLSTGPCNAPNAPVVSARFPSDVEVATPRLVPCGH